MRFSRIHMSSTYDDLHHKFSAHLADYNDQKRRAADILNRLIAVCVEQHGVPCEHISCHPPSSDIPEDRGRPPAWVIEQKPNGSWGLNLVIRIGSSVGGSGYMVSATRPEVLFDGSHAELRLADDATPTIIDATDEASALRTFATRVIKHIEKSIFLLGKPQDQQRRIVGFHSGEK